MGAPQQALLAASVEAGGNAVDFVIVTTGTDDDLLTVASATADTLPSIGDAAWSLEYHDPLEHTRVDASDPVRRTSLTAGGVSYNGTGYKSLIFNLTEALIIGADPMFEGMRLTPPTDEWDNGLSFTGLTKFGHLNGSTDVSFDTWAVYTGGGGYLTIQYYTPGESGDSQLRVEGQVPGGGTDRGRNIRIPSRTTFYSWNARANKAEQRAEIMLVDNDTGIVMGTSEIATSVEAIISMIRQDYLLFAASGGGQIVHGLAGVNFTTAAYPLEPVTIPAPTDAVATQTAQSTVTLTWESVTQRLRIERETNDSGTWDTLEAEYNVSSADITIFVDDTVVDGETYRYRVIALAGDDLESPPSAESDPVTIDDSLAPESSDDFTTYSTFTDLDDTTRWEASTNKFLVLSSSAFPPPAIWRVFMNGNGSVGFAHITDSGYNEAQGSEVLIAETTGATYAGVAVSVQADLVNGYFAQTNGTDLQLAKRISGTDTVLMSDASGNVGANQLMRLWRTGTGSATRLRLEIDSGSGWVDKWTNIDPGDYLTDGQPGLVCGIISDPDTSVAEWKGYNAP